MNLTRLTFTLDGHTVAVEGYHHQAYAGSWAEAPEPETFSISRTEILKQADAEDPVSIDDLDEEDLAAAALRAWRQRDECGRAQYADMRREEMRLGARV
jgi:hypothetical protein